MTNIKNIVKVMNFHSLIRVEKSKNIASKYFEFEKEITKLLYTIVNNRNLKLDKKLLIENPKGIIINIYIGNDLGFCGSFNSQIYSSVKYDKESYKVIIGKKLFGALSDDSNVLFRCEKEEFQNNVQEIENIIKKCINDKKVKEINIIYNRYQSITEIEYDVKKIFPIEENKKMIKESDLKKDFLIETNIDDIVSSLVVLYICYNIKILGSNSYAAENIMRERITRESIKKIEDIENETIIKQRIEKKDIDFKKQINIRQNQQ